MSDTQNAPNSKAIATVSMVRWSAITIIICILSITGYYSLETFLSPQNCTEDAVDALRTCLASVPSDDEPSCMTEATKMIGHCVEGNSE